MPPLLKHLSWSQVPTLLRFSQELMLLICSLVFMTLLSHQLPTITRTSQELTKLKNSCQLNCLKTQESSIFRDCSSPI